MAALAQPTRRSTFRQLVAHEPGGLAAGEIAQAPDVQANALSTHLALLSLEGLTLAERQSRSIIYRARIDRLRDLILLLAKDCCRAREELCAPLL